MATKCEVTGCDLNFEHEHCAVPGCKAKPWVDHKHCPICQASMPEGATRCVKGHEAGDYERLHALRDVDVHLGEVDALLEVSAELMRDRMPEAAQAHALRGIGHALAAIAKMMRGQQKGVQ
jgi:predicted nucleic acid-binding Zn ribbon protein